MRWHFLKPSSLQEHEKNTERVIRGLKASIHNPRVSHEAKVHAEERLRELGQVIEPRQTAGTGRRRPGTNRLSHGIDDVYSTMELGRKVRRASAASKPTEAIPGKYYRRVEIHDVFIANL